MAEGFADFRVEVILYIIVRSGLQIKLLAWEIGGNEGPFVADATVQPIELLLFLFSPFGTGERIQNLPISGLQYGLPISALLGVSLHSVLLGHFLGHQRPLFNFELVVQVDDHSVLLRTERLILGHL